MDERDNARFCAFCGTRNKLSNEHLWPEWVREVLIPQHNQAAPYVWTEGRPSTDEMAVRRIRHGMPTAAIEVKRVCKPCNETWMSNIEGEAKPILTRPIQGDPITLKGNALTKVASWVYLKALVADLATSAASPNVGPLTFHHMHQHHRPPESALISIACYSGIRHPLYAGTRQISLKLDTGSGPPTPFHAYLITLGVGHFVAQVFGHHLNRVIDLRPADWKRTASRVIWPQAESVEWPPPVRLTDKTLFRFSGTTPPPKAPYEESGHPS
jgi:hypothetical protein